MEAPRTVARPLAMALIVARTRPPDKAFTLLSLGAAGLIAAAVVPAKVFSPVFRKVIEWIEYLLIVAIPPLAIWLLNLIYLARNM